jgi:centrin-1
MAELGFEAHRKEVDAVFDEWDKDGEGLLDYDEINKRLRRGADVKLDEKLQDGAAGKIETKSQNKSSRDLNAGGAGGAAAAREAAKKKGGMGPPPKGRDLKRESTHLKFDIDESPGAPPVSAQLREALSKNGVRVIDMFRDWDDDGSGTVSRKEWRKAMAELGFEAHRKEVDAVFNEWDKDGEGLLDYDEINKRLRRGADVKLDGALQDGAAGKIETKSQNKSSRDLLGEDSSVSRPPASGKKKNPKQAALEARRADASTRTYT